MTLRGERAGKVSKAWSTLDVPVTTRIVMLLLLVALSMLLLDQPIARWVTSLTPWARTFAIWISEAASPVFVLALLLALSIFSIVHARARQAPVPTFCVSGLSCGLAAVVSSLLIKNMIGRARPSALHGWDSWLFKPFAFDDAFASLPSAQAALAAAITCSAAVHFPRYRVCLLTTGVLICVARVFAGEHWTSDVIAGWTLGWLVTRVLRQLFKQTLFP